MDAKLRTANVVVIVYSETCEVSFQRVASYWMPYIRTMVSEGVPCVIVGNKIDVARQSFEVSASSSPFVNSLCDASPDTVRNREFENKVYPLIEQFHEIQFIVDCSAKSVYKVSDVCFNALKAVLHPSRPLYNWTRDAIEPKFHQALDRIFSILDTENVGYLSEAKLQDFQIKCFSKPLSVQDVEQIRSVLEQRSSSALTADGGITLIGFVELNTYAIEIGKPEIPWGALRRYGYDLNLNIRMNCWKTDFNDAKRFDLSDKAVSFLTDWFNKRLCNNKEEADWDIVASWMKKLELVDGDMVYAIGQHNSIGQGLFIALWDRATVLYPKRVAHALAYLWYNDFEDMDSAFDVGHKIQSILVTGPSKCGKSTLILSLIGLRSLENSINDPMTICLTGLPGQVKRTVVVHEGHMDDRRVNEYDSVCLCYDASQDSTMSKPRSNTSNTVTLGLQAGEDTPGAVNAERMSTHQLQQVLITLNLPTFQSHHHSSLTKSLLWVSAVLAVGVAGWVVFKRRR